jgi:hypothetical protein
MSLKNLEISKPNMDNAFSEAILKIKNLLVPPVKLTKREKDLLLVMDSNQRVLSLLRRTIKQTFNNDRITKP